MSDFRDTLYTIDTKGKRKWVYPTVAAGFFRSRRITVITFLIALYLLLPWIVINGHQAVQLDISDRKFIFFGGVFHATDTFYLFLFLGTLAFSLFFTALLGRVWCGWACPETVFLEFVFRPIERLIEGNAAQRQRLDREPLSITKAFKKSIKLLTFVFISWILASTGLAYFVGSNELLKIMSGSPMANSSLFIVMLLWTSALVFQFGWFREQFCTVLCPYARLQSVMLDSDSLVISYDRKRGEPRGKKEGAGDCIDCGYCVRVCPTGIDIRNGLQLECVQCASCIDSCNSIMAKTGRPEGLVRYTTERVLNEKILRLVRPRVVLYALIVSAYLITLGFGLTHRKATEFQFIRVSKDSPFTLDQSGTVTNHFRVHLANRSDQQAAIEIHVLEQPRAQTVVPVSPLLLAADSETDLPLFVRFSRDILSNGKAVVRVELRNNGERFAVTNLPLIGPDL